MVVPWSCSTACRKGLVHGIKADLDGQIPCHRVAEDGEKRSVARRWLGLDAGLESGAEALGGRLRSRAPLTRQGKVVAVFMSAHVCPGAG